MHDLYALIIKCIENCKLVLFEFVMIFSTTNVVVVLINKTCFIYYFTLPKFGKEIKNGLFQTFVKIMASYFRNLMGCKMRQMMTYNRPDREKF